MPEPGETVRPADAAFSVSGVATREGEHPWAGQASYGKLVQRYTLSSGLSPRAVSLDFASPTVFRSQGQDLPLPLPSQVFGSYLSKWNAFAPLTLPEEAARYARECILLGRFNLRSHLVSYEAGDRGPASRLQSFFVLCVARWFFPLFFAFCSVIMSAVEHLLDECRVDAAVISRNVASYARLLSV